MRIVDRYVIKHFLLILIAALFAFVIIFLLVDLIENLDMFIDNKAPLMIVIKYYALYIPYMASLVLPVAVLLSCLFTIGQMVRHNELVALKASGVSLYRVLFPLFRLGILISVLALLFGEFVVPTANFRRTNVKSEEIKRGRSKGIDSVQNRVFQDKDSPNRHIYIKKLTIESGTATGILIQEFEGVSFEKIIGAERMVWKKNTWILQNVTILKPEFKQLAELSRPDFAFTPQDIAQKSKDPEEMSILELRDHIEVVKNRSNDAQTWITEFHFKLSFPLANLIIVLFGTALASVQRKSGAAVGFGFSLFICFVYYAVMEASRAAGRAGDLAPLAAAWIGNGIFGLVGLSILVKARK